MRRRRQLLQVTTFPFLAVLLCAMGSLLLLLLVIDRRAKVVARAKALELVAQSEERERQRLATLKAQRDRKYQQQDRDLARQVGLLALELRNTRGQESGLLVALRETQGQYQSLESRLRATNAQLGTARSQIDTNRAETEAQAKLARKAEQELIRQQAELSRTEHAVGSLKARRQQDERTYSLIPYRGARGENRRPIYLECTARGLVFHPDRVELPLSSKTPPEIRAEMERRLTRLPGESADAAPFVYLLVRPDGIVSYYRAQAALDGIKTDFGYEFIEPDWILDFSDTERTAKQPWIAAAPKGDSKPLPGRPTIGPETGTMSRFGPVQNGVPEAPRSAPPPMGQDTAGGTGRNNGVPTHGSAAPGGSLPQAPQAPIALGSSGGPARTNTPPQVGATPATPGGTKPGAPKFSGTQGSPAGATQAKILPPVGATNAPKENGEATGALPALLRPTENPGPARPAPLSRLTGNRDWLIVVECGAEGVVLQPTGQRFPTAALQPTPGQEQLLVTAVRQLIVKRQATVRPGEAPFRPLLRFRVSPQGLQAYYLAYPLLDALRLPMSRENQD
jgi:hypothetical protein